MCLGVSILLGQSKVNDIDLVASLSNAHEEVVWLDVSVDKVARVNVFNARDLSRGKGKQVQSVTWPCLVG